MAEAGNKRGLDSLFNSDNICYILRFCNNALQVYVFFRLFRRIKQKYFSHSFTEKTER